ncbi:heavy metal translocating P-type ATPase [Methanobrevibacter acididurans]|uniref:heavy metal translocating P-type ATPase n=1 Tax=Methanobrevibacter acididurans TaxID=120963 RepID=UPI0038FCD59F
MNINKEDMSLKKLNELLAGLKMTIISGIFLAISLVFMVFHIQSPIDPAWGAVIISGFPLIYLALIRVIKEKFVSSALLITVAMIASIGIGQIFAAGEVAFIMSLGALLEDYTVDRAQNGLKNLINLTPQKGRKIIQTNNGNFKEEIVNVNEINLKDTLRVLPGEVIPVDGVITKGNTSLDQSIMTGESLPIDKKPGDEVFCGTMNLYGSVDMETTSRGEDSSLQKLIDMVRDAENKQAPTQRIADKWATWLVPVALLIAICAFIFTGDINRAVTVLVVFCPCALILATPTSIMAAIGQATKYGVIIKSGEALENLGKTNIIAFDKTGTLTYGDLKVSDVISKKENLSNEQLLKITASCEKRSEHPLAKALIKYTEENNIKFDDCEDFQMIPGKGVKSKIDQEEIFCGNLNFIKENNINTNGLNETLKYLNNEGKANIIVANENEILGIIALSDILCEDAKEMIKNLEELNTKVILLTGDNIQAANYFSKQVGISNVHAELLPEDKVKQIQKIKDNNEMVAMIGDGVNDAPALKTANISVAMAKMGSDIAIEAADVALLGDDIEKIPYLKKLSNATLYNIHFNITLSMCINAVAIFCSVMGWLNPVTGALVHNIGSCVVIANAGFLYDRKFDDNIKKYNPNEPVKNNEILTHSHDKGNLNHSHKNLDLGEVITFNGSSHTHKHMH